MDELHQWFQDTFTPDELEEIQSRYSRSSAVGEVGRVLPRNYIKHLYTVAGLYINQPMLAEKMLDKAYDLLETQKYTYMDAHYLHSEAARIYFKNRANDNYRIKAIKSCTRQIKIAHQVIRAFNAEQALSNREIPVHNGYEQLSDMLENRKMYDQSIKLCNQALKQGWPGPWESRIERCKHKILETGNSSKAA